MKKSKIISGVVGALVLAWAGGAWYTGSLAEKEYLHQIEVGNVKLQQAILGYPLQIEYKNISYDRGHFSSDVKDELIIRSNEKTWVIPFSEKIYHGPFPFNRVIKFNFMPTMLAAEGQLDKNETTQFLFDLTKNERPVTFSGVVSYALNTAGTIDILGGEYNDNEGALLSWAPIKLVFDLNKNSEGSSELLTDKISLNIAADRAQDRSPLVLSLNKLKLNADVKQTQWTSIFAGKTNFNLASFEIKTETEEGKPFTFGLNNLASTSVISAEDKFVNQKSDLSVESLNIEGKALGKLTYAIELNHFDGQSLNDLYALISELSGPNRAIAQTKVEQKIQLILLGLVSGQPQIKIAPLALSDKNGKIQLDLNLALKSSPKFASNVRSVLKQFNEFSVNIDVNKNTAAALLNVLTDDDEDMKQINLREKIEEFAVEGQQQGIVVNNADNMTLNLALDPEKVELKLNGNVIPEEKIQAVLFMLAMGVMN